MSNGYAVSSRPATVGTPSTIVAPANPLREYLLLQNDSGVETVYIQFDKTAGQNEGVKLLPGGSYEMIAGQNLFKGDMHAISTNPAVLLVAEMTGLT